ncbi:SLBB domain-containing protein [Mucilaginibacter psychrotolerans]|uniref:Capsule biosynthesis protein n=1 Tax=Mucilaginibacter psychrotolerans TaxID=1524096 RepID=A0A4Y8SAG4_9SPHI|nr:SLBB domain-containing protein [Mucilaginibacter psychrotolerans]TFF35537.1 capsule biosynthesis protein [Mucilaginibacter psychrotolerans]
MDRLKPCFILLVTLLWLVCISPANAQNLPQNLSGVNVNDMSDEQLRQALQQAQASGLSDATLLQTLQARGLSATQIQLLQTRIAALRKTAGAIQPSTQEPSVLARGLNYQPDTSNTPAGDKIYGLFTPKIFGANLFRNSNITFEPNLKLATPVNYILGPDDQLNINVYGASLVNWKLDVSPEGNINIPGVGILNVSGKTIEQATTSIKSKLAANNYAVGRGTSVQVGLGNIRSIKVIMVGEVVKPGTYTLSSLATAFNALYAAGGPGENGSFRQIEIIRNNRIVRRLDVYDFLVKGDQKDNIGLQDQDIIRVPTYRTRVQLAGEVKNPALFEVLAGESLQDVLRFAGGFSNEAYTARIKVSQISDQQRRITDVVEADYKNYVPLRGDKFTVERILNRFENRVTINGAVFRPGEYELQKGLTISQLIKNAAGLREDAFSARGSIARLKADNSFELVSFDVNEVMNKTAPDILLQREDVVTVTSITELRDEYRITIKGEVRNQGDFPYAENMSVEDLIIKAGGFTEGASARRIEVARRTNNGDPNSATSTLAEVFNIDVDPQLKKSSANFKLQPFDIVSIYSLPGYEKQSIVKIEGEVLYPGYYAVKFKNEKVSDLLTRAGGLTTFADIDGASLKRNALAIFVADKNGVDTNAIETDRLQRLNKLKQFNKDSTVTDSNELKYNFIGINLRSILKAPGSNIDLIVQNSDVISIPKQQQVVYVHGEVLYPSAVVFESGKSFNDYILGAGGYSSRALKRGSYVVYANHTVRGTGKFLFFNVHPEVRAGSEIYVTRKPERRGLSATEVVGLTSGLASLGAIILGIINLSK